MDRFQCVQNFFQKYKKYSNHIDKKYFLYTQVLPIEENKINHFLMATSYQIIKTVKLI